MKLVTKKQRPNSGKAKRLRILHLGFEDYKRPGSGGGSIRTHEINKRIARNHDVTVLVTRFKGSRDRVEDGIHYVHIGLPIGYFPSLISYFIAVPFAALRHTSDLIVEDFAPPFSSCLSPLWSRKPKLAMVQWLNAKEKSRQYHVPFWVVEKIGLQLHRQYITVSSAIARNILAENAKAQVAVISNGVPKTAFDEPLTKRRQDILYVGRLERAQKGLDLLIDAYAAIADKTQAKLIIVGDGPDEKWLRTRISELGLTNRVALKGRVEGQAKHALLASSTVVAMPSRFETFGMVAVEALAEGTPVVAFDLPPLAEVIPDGLGKRVASFDITAFAAALLSYINADDTLVTKQERRNFALQYDWDYLAEKQQIVYEWRVII
jgi:glycosyltransferase involved in cell wall biosynthesis